MGRKPLRLWKGQKAVGAANLLAFRALRASGNLCSEAPLECKAPQLELAHLQGCARAQPARTAQVQQRPRFCLDARGCAGSSALHCSPMRPTPLAAEKWLSGVRSATQQMLTHDSPCVARSHKLRTSPLTVVRLSRMSMVGLQSRGKSCCAQLCIAPQLRVHCTRSCGAINESALFPSVMFDSLDSR